MRKELLPVLLLLITGCSPLKSPPDEEHQNELTLHQMKASIDDLKHDVHCFKTDIDILDEKFSHTKSQKEFERLIKYQKETQEQIAQLNEKLHGLQAQQAQLADNLNKLGSFSEDTSLALNQFKQKITELKKNQKEFNSAIAQIMSLKYSIKELANFNKDKSYTVQPGDTLEKIAGLCETTVLELKKANHLKNDLIIAGQELTIP